MSPIGVYFFFIFNTESTLVSFGSMSKLKKCHIMSLSIPNNTRVEFRTMMEQAGNIGVYNLIPVRPSE